MNMTNQMMNFMMNCMALYNFFNNMKRNNYNTMEMHKPSIKGGKRQRLPRKQEKITHMVFPQYQGNRYNIDFQTSAGHKVMMSVPINSKIGDILLEYIAVVGIGPGVIENGIYFVFNGNKITKKDYNKTLTEMGISTLSHILVIDSQNLIAA